MTRDEIRHALERHTDALNRHDIAALVALYAPDAVIVSPMFETVRGHAAVRLSFERLFAIYPDYAVEMVDTLFICEGNRAAEFGRVRGTQRLDLFGLPPTGQPIEYQTGRLFTFRDGRIAYEQRFYDFHGVLDRFEKMRLDHDLAVAATVQHLLLARADHRTPHVDVVGSSLSCRAIGGDFVECVDLPSGALGLGVGDVSGKGPAAALVATMLQGMLSVMAEASLGPSDVLARVNRGLCRRAIAPRYATLVYAVIEPDGRFIYSNGGHNPPILLTAAGATPLTAGGTLLGVFEGAAFPEETVVLQPGDTVIAFSDGATDAINPEGEPFGADRLLACARAGRGSSARALLETLFAAVQDFARGTPPPDDVTIVVARLL